jgi:hypothetical protein
VCGQDVPNLAYTLGRVPDASRIRMGVSGLLFFMVGYARVMKDLVWVGEIVSQRLGTGVQGGRAGEKETRRERGRAWKGWNGPRGSAVLARLAKQEADLLQRLGEGVLARHGEWRGGCPGSIASIGAVEDVPWRTCRGGEFDVRSPG